MDFTSQIEIKMDKTTYHHMWTFQQKKRTHIAVRTIF